MDTSEAPLYYSVIACGIIILLINCIFIGSSIWMQRKFKVKRRKRAEAEVLNIEKERTRIGADLHDVSGPIIYSIKRKIEDAIGADEKSRSLLHDGAELLFSLSEQLNALSKTMVPLSLERKGLLYSLEELVFEKSIEHNLEIILRCESLPRLDKKAETHIYRMIQEIIYNTVKHAEASILIIEFEICRQQLILRTSDNGKGCDMALIKKYSKGFGIGNIETRASFLNGSACMHGSNGCKWEVRMEVG